METKKDCEERVKKYALGYSKVLFVDGIGTCSETFFAEAGQRLKQVSRIRKKCSAVIRSLVSSSSTDARRNERGMTTPFLFVSYTPCERSDLHFELGGEIETPSWVSFSSSIMMEERTDCCYWRWIMAGDENAMTVRIFYYGTTMV